MPSVKSLILSLVLLGIVGTAHSETPLFQASSKEMGIKEFDLTVTEIDRKKRVSTLDVPGFHSRTAAGSRWLMCAYTALAMQRGFKYWTVIYPEKQSEKLIIGFPDTSTENIAETLGPIFANKKLLPPTPTEKLAIICGLTSPPA